ncbi:hypothetical protein RJ55_03700 [Drechmeria coniospora]|nr:hypothetical protein RJ55_03700 [Drechmeria coniospora]
MASSVKLLDLGDRAAPGPRSRPCPALTHAAVGNRADDLVRAVHSSRTNDVAAENGLSGPALPTRLRDRQQLLASWADNTLTRRRRRRRRRRITKRRVGASA